MGENTENTVTVRATRAVLGLKPGEIGEVPDDDYTRSAIEAGHLEKASDDDAAGQQRQGGQEDDAEQSF
jgi:hypothetical protein